MFKRIFAIVMVLMLATAVVAQDEPVPQVVEVEASDGLVLQGDFYTLEGEAPTVLLMHMLSGRRGDWEPVIPALLEAGYQVLTVDLRGHGRTGGRSDWTLAQEDVAVWLTWLREQPSVRDDAVSIAGASVGSSLTLAGCAADESCVSAILFSPVDFQIIEEDAALEALDTRPVMIFSGLGDRESALRVREIAGAYERVLGVRVYDTRLHGTTMLRDPAIEESIIPLLIGWLDEQTPE